MDPIYDLATLRNTLRDGIAKGYWTLEMLDVPSVGRQMLEQDMKQHKVLEFRRLKPPPHQNLLRPPDQQQPPPSEELDGITVHTNDHPIPPELPF